MIKFFIKGFGILKKAFSVYRVLLISIGAVSIFMGVQQVRIKAKDRTINAHEKTISTLKQKAEQAQEANKTTNESLTACLGTNESLTRQGISIRAENDQAIEDVQKYAVKQDKKILELKSKIKPDKDCSLDRASAHNTRLLKEANNQD